MNRLNISIIFIGLVLCFFFIKGNSKAQESVHDDNTTNYLTEEQSDKRIYRPVPPEIENEKVTPIKIVNRLDWLEARVDSLEAKLERAHVVYHEDKTDRATYKVFWKISFEPKDSLGEK